MIDRSKTGCGLPAASLLLLLLIWPVPSVVQGQSREEFESDDPSGALSPTPGETTGAETEVDLEQVRRRIVRRTNRFREKNGLAPVESAENLHEAAEYFAQFMARTGKYGHTADGQRPSQRATNHGYEFCIVLENIAYYQNPRDTSGEALVRTFVQGWKNSPGHRENMLDPAVTETGVAVAESEEGGTFFAVQMFGRPASATIDFSIFNRTDQAIEYRVLLEEKGRKFELPPGTIRTHRRCRPTRLRLADGGEPIPTEDDAEYVVQQGTEQQPVLRRKESE